MTFSVDSDFWLFQPSARRDELTRPEASEGGGKAFARSLFDVSATQEAPRIDTRLDGDPLIFASLSLAPASNGTDGSGDGSEQVAVTFEAPLPDTDLSQIPAAAVATEVAELKASHPDEMQLIGGGTTPTLSQIVLPDSNMSPGVLSLADPDTSEDAPSAKTIPADRLPPIPPSAELTTIAIMKQASTEASDINPALPLERNPLAPAASDVVADTHLHEATASPQTTLIMPAPSESVSPPEIEQPAASPVAQARLSPLASDIAEPAETSPPAVPVPAEAMRATPPATVPTIVSTPSTHPTAPIATAPASDTRRAHPAPTEPEMQPVAPDGTPVEMIDTAAPLASISDTPASPQAGTDGDAASGTPVTPLSAGGGFLPGQPAGQIATPPASTPLTPTHAVLIAAPSHLPDIVARATRDGGQEDRITVQLDPPELGRISIDFRFDGQGLQHVTLTAETPEAMRQLRQMHFELVQALERNGLSGQDMTFQHHNPQQNEGWGQQTRPGGARPEAPPLTSSGLIMSADNTPSRQTASSGRLDIRL